MKKLFYLLATLPFGQNLSAQNEAPTILSVYEFTRPVTLSQSTLLGTLVAGPITETIPAGYQFIVQNVTATNDIVIALLRWDYPNTPKAGKQALQASANQALNTRFRGSQTYDPAIYFLIPFAQFRLVTEKLQGKISFTIGTATTLVKYRPGSNTINGEIGNDINIGGLFGFRLWGDKITQYFLLGASVGSVKLTPTNTRNKITEDANEFALTPSLGYVFDFKRGQVGLFSGIDILSGGAYRSWVYRGRPWIGFGIGLSIFKDTNENKNKTTDQK